MANSLTKVMVKAPWSTIRSWVGHDDHKTSFRLDVNTFKLDVDTCKSGSFSAIDIQHRWLQSDKPRKKHSDV